VPPGAPSVGAAVGGTAMGLLPGERLSLHDLLYGMLLPSGNDAAYTVAQAVAGSQQAFAALMNAKATALGLLGTHFAQSYGFDEADQYSTAWDLMRLARYDLRHYPLFDRIVATAYRYIGPGLTHPDFALHNLNRLLGVYPGVIGVKTDDASGNAMQQPPKETLIRRAVTCSSLRRDRTAMVTPSAVTINRGCRRRSEPATSSVRGHSIGPSCAGQSRRNRNPRFPKGAASLDTCADLRWRRPGVAWPRPQTRPRARARRSGCWQYPASGLPWERRRRSG
jgi:hypothetical protein